MLLFFFSLEEIRLEKFQEAVDDCNHVLSMEPKNVKGIAAVLFCATELKIIV